MGWWKSGSNEDHGDLIWGDGPADTLDEAIEQIINEFQGEWRRPPRRAELEAGLRFALGKYEES